MTKARPFVRRNADQTNYHLRNSATDLSLPKPKREFLKRNFKYSGAMLWKKRFSEDPRFVEVQNEDPIDFNVLA